jgi:hypothetical protein
VFVDFVGAVKTVRPKVGTSVAARMLARSPTRAWKSIWSCECIFCVQEVELESLQSSGDADPSRWSFVGNE